MKKLLLAVFAAVIAFAPLTVKAEGSPVSGNAIAPTGNTSVTENGTSYFKAGKAGIDFKDGKISVVEISGAEVEAKFSAYLPKDKGQTAVFYEITASEGFDVSKGYNINFLAPTNAKIVAAYHYTGNGVEVLQAPYTVTSLSPFMVVTEPTVAASTTTTTTPAAPTEKVDGHYNPSLNPGDRFEVIDPNGNPVTMVSLGNGRYYNPFYTVFDGEGNVVGKYNPTTGTVSSLVAEGTYIVPNTADKK